MKRNCPVPKRQEFLVIILLLTGFILTSHVQSPPSLSPGKAGARCEWHFSGHLGETLDRIAGQRILDQESWNLIYPETEEAFRLREDDLSYPKYGRWRGEFWGKYILSVIAACNYYQSEELEQRIRDAVEGLISTQEENGYIGTYVHSDFLVGNNWNVWCRKYTLWGLVEAWELLGDEKILETAERFAGQLISQVGPGAVDIVRTGNFYGMPSTSILQPMVKLYKSTGNPAYLKYAEYIVGQWAQHPEGLPDIFHMGLTGKPVHQWFPDTDPYQWAKGYEFTSCVEGMVELYIATGNQSYLQSAKNIHAAMVEFERTPVGSVSFNDKFVGSAGLINTLSEVCDAVYWNRLSHILFQVTGEEKYVSEIERTLYNALLCSYNPQGDWCLRRLRMSHMHIPAQNHFLQQHQCCTDNLPRGLFQAAESALTMVDGEAHLSLYSPGEGRIIFPSEKEVKLEMTGDFLEEPGIRIRISTKDSLYFPLKIREPHWCSRMQVRLNGKPLPDISSEGWLRIDRTWKEGDLIDIAFTMSLRWETFNPAKFPAEFHEIGFYDQEWARMKFSMADNPELVRRYSHIESLDTGEALPQHEAVCFFYGPLALSRDARISGEDVFSPVIRPENASPPILEKVESPPGMWKAYVLKMGAGLVIPFCDFSSAGNTWDDHSNFSTWCIVK